MLTLRASVWGLGNRYEKYVFVYMSIYICVCILHMYVYKFIYLPYNTYLSYWCSEEHMHGLFVCLSKLQESITAVWCPFLWWASFLVLAFTDSLISPLLWLLIYISVTLDSLIVGRPSLTSCAALSDILHVVDHQDVFGINTYLFFLPLSFSLCYFIDIICIYENGS